jgi:predicted ATPase/DNA-binding SARP family transcriptional activator
MNQSWRITLLGGLRVERGEEAADKQVITRFKSHKVGGLLAYLAYHLRQAHSREVLIEMFWPDSPPEQGRNSLSAALSSLRSQLEPPGTPAGAVIRADRYSVGLNPATVTTDVAEFQATLKDAAKAGSATERAQCLGRAIDLYQGRLLPGHYDEWITPEGERLSGLFLEAAARLIAEREAGGDLSAALTCAGKAVSADPLSEDANRHLIRLLAAAGQPGAALRQYKEYERRLGEELGEEPSSPLRALARQIEKDTGVAAPSVPPPRSVVTGSSSFSLAANGPTTVTFLLTDIEGSTRLFEQARDAYPEAVARHHELLRSGFARHGGREIKEAGDSFVVAFASAGRALACAVACQQALAGEVWPEAIGPLRVRMAIHTGDVEEKGGSYQGLVLHRASRMLTAAHGGQILLSEITAGLVRRDLPHEVRLLDLGVYRLRDVPSPERLFQAEYPGMGQHDFGPLAAEAGYGANLPLTFTRFFGREREIAELTEMLRSGGVRLVTITGPGGTGKTRLALQVAERLSGNFHGAVWFVGLADISDPQLIAGTILDSLRVPRSPQREPIDQVVEALGRQPSLLVLDNMEHLLGEAGVTGLVEDGASLVQTLLRRVPSLTLLITSRQLLGLSAEREYILSPLPTPHGDNGGPEQLSAYDSVRLFIDRAQQAKTDFQISNGNAPAVAELCDRLEGIPLAIELAAARAQVLTPAQMLAQLSSGAEPNRRFDLLASRRRDLSERQRTLKGAVEWSYRLLSPELQRFFCRLSVFRGGWSVEAAEAVCEEPLALDYLAQLRECSLVLAHEAGEQIRFSMLETLREFGRERLVAAAEEMSASKRHRDYFLALAEAADRQLIGPEEKRGLERLDANQDNLRAALSWSLTDPAGAEPGLRLAATLRRFWWIRGNMREGQQWLRAMLEREGASARTLERAAALTVLGALLQLCAEWEAARPYLEEGLAIRQEFD